MQCDICGGTLEVQGIGNAVCTVCGLAYSKERLLEKAKTNKASSITSNTTSVVVPLVGQSNNISNMINLAQLHMSDKKYDQANATCDKILEMDYTNGKAWEIKIQSTQLDTKQAAIFLNEYYTSAITESDRNRIINFGANYFSELKISFPKSGANPGDYQNFCEAAVILLSIDSNIANCFLNGILKGMMATWEKSLEIIKQNAATEEKNKPSKYHDRYNPDVTWYKHSIESHLNSLHNNSENFFKTLIQYINSKNSDIAENVCQLCNTISSYLSCIKSFKVWNYTFDHTERGYIDRDVYKHNLTHMYYKDSWVHKYISQIEGYLQTACSAAKKIMQQQERIRLEEKQRIINQYWNEHAEEKQALEQEKKQLQQSIEQIKKDINENPLLEEKSQLNKKIELLNCQRRNLGLFKAKEKKAIDEQISNIQEKLNSVIIKYRDIENTAQNKIKRLNAQIKQILNTLEKIPNQTEKPTQSNAYSFESKEESDVVDIILTHIGNNKLSVIKVIRESLEMSLQDAYTITENIPNTIASNISIYRAKTIKSNLEEMGATVEIV